MKPGKTPNKMVAQIEKRRVGRPLKFAKGGRLQCHLLIPEDLRKAAEVVQDERKLPDLGDAVRELMREAAEARGLVDPRK